MTEARQPDGKAVGDQKRERARRRFRWLGPFLAHPIISSIIASVLSGAALLFLGLWLAGQPPFERGTRRYLCSNPDKLGARPDLRRFGVSHVRGGYTIASGPSVSPFVKWGGGNIECEYFRVPLIKGQRIKIEWHKLAGGCCMHFYLWRPSVTDADVAKATSDELRARHSELSLEVAEGNSTVEYASRFTGKATLQVGDGNATGF